MRSELTPIINHVNEVITYVRENLDDQEYDLFLDLIVPEPEPQTEKPKPRKPKKILHCDACNYTKHHQVHKDNSRSDYHEFQSAKGSSKSKRAKGIAAALNENLQQGKEAKTEGDNGNSHEGFNLACTHQFSDSVFCAKTADDNIHHLATHPDYHEFVEGDKGKSHALAAGGE